MPFLCCNVLIFAKRWFLPFAGEKATSATRVQELEKKLKDSRKRLEEAEARETLQTHWLRALSQVLGGNMFERIFSSLI